jgi:hypothetical protein
MAESVAEKLCEEKHKRVDEQLNRLNDHADRIKELEAAGPVQAEINKQLMEQLEELKEWKRQQEAKPQRRFNQIIDIIVQWATLAILVILAAKVGLQ